MSRPLRVELTPAPAPPRVVLTCTSCAHSYEPTAEDFAFGRTDCPDPDCPGWTFWAHLTSPEYHESRPAGRSRGEPR